MSADLSVLKTVSNATPNVGDAITFTVTLSDQGPDAATGVTVADLLPAGLSLVMANPSQGSYDNTSGVWTVGTVSPGGPQTLSIIATVVNPVAQTNTATITNADQFDPNTANNSASATEAPQQADLSVSKTVSDATPNVGDAITFTVMLSDQGPDAATGVTVADLLPAGLSLVMANPSQGTYDNGSGVWTVGTVSPGGPQTLSIIATVVNPVAQTNTATVTNADQFDPNTANNSASATEAPQQADLSVSKTVSDATPNVGDAITFTVTLSDQGPDAATGVTVADLLPAGLSLVMANPSQGTYDNGSGVWTVGTVSPGGPQTLNITATVVNPVAQTNTATITNADQFDPNTANNSASATEAPQQADLSVSKTVSDATPNVGDQIIFTVTLSDQGPDAATGVTVADLLPAGLSLVMANPSQGTYDNGSGVWTVGTVSPGAAQTLNITATVVSPLAQTNVVAISNADQFDPDTANNSASATEAPQQADLSVTKTVSDATPNVGDQIIFTVTLSDQGPDAATGVRVTDLLPAGVSFLLANPSQGSYDNTSGVWTVGTVNPVAAQTLNITATVVSPVAQTNTVTISHADQFDPNTANNTASAIVGINDLLVATDSGPETLSGLGGDDTLLGLGSGTYTLDGGTGNDLLNAGGSGNGTLTGGLGNDTLVAFGNGKYSLDGGSGNDLLDADAGSSGNDTLDGGTGDNALYDNSAGIDSLIGGAGSGNDTLAALGSGTYVLDASGETGSSSLYAAGANDTLTGGIGNDTLTAAGSGDSASGGAGDDSLQALGTGDSLFGDAGNDTLDGTSGNGRYLLDGGTGNNALYANGAFNDTLVGGAGSGNDTLVASGSGTFTLDASGETGRSSLYAAGANDTLTGGVGNDTLTAAGSGDSASGGAGDDSLQALGTNDSLFGDGGNDTLDGAFNGNYRLDGGTGDNALYAEGLGNDTLIGGAGSGSDTLAGTGGGTYALDASGETGNSFLYTSGSGNDTMIGGAGNDSLVIAGTGNDTVDGGLGNDTLAFNGRTQAEIFSEATAGGVTTIIFDSAAGQKVSFQGVEHVLFTGDGTSQNDPPGFPPKP